MTYSAWPGGTSAYWIARTTARRETDRRQALGVYRVHGGEEAQDIPVGGFAPDIPAPPFPRRPPGDRPPGPLGGWGVRGHALRRATS